MNIVFLGSGHLGFEVLRKLVQRYTVCAVMTDKKSSEIIIFCEEKSIRCFIGNPRNGTGASFIANIKMDLLVSVNYLFIVKDDILCQASQLAINFHGSLLPKYRGRTPHVWAIINSERQTGVTAHVMTQGCDEGDIIDQRIVPIKSDDTGNSILMKFALLYPDFVVEVLSKIENGKYELRKQNHEIATYFGKRTPEDGLIDWNWQKERVYNWVRALAAPYPCAFSFQQGVKVKINKIEYSEFGFTNYTVNGTIVEIDQFYPIVKTPNGCIKLLDYNCELKLTKGMILNG
jgi:methionyl-tRNA formyltransferase